MTTGKAMWSEYLRISVRSRNSSANSAASSRRCRVTRVPRSARSIVLDAELALAVRLPVHALGGRRAGPARLHDDPVGHDEGRVEADAELADEIGVLLLLAAELADEVAGAGPGDGAELAHHFFPGHADAVVDDRDGPGRRVVLHADLQLGIGLQQRGVGQRLEAQPVGGIGGIGDQLPEKDLPVAVEGVDHEVQQFLHLGLETVGFARSDGHGRGYLEDRSGLYRAARREFKRRRVASGNSAEGLLRRLVSRNSGPGRASAGCRRPAGSAGSAALAPDAAGASPSSAGFRRPRTPASARSIQARRRSVSSLRINGWSRSLSDMIVRISSIRSLPASWRPSANRYWSYFSSGVQSRRTFSAQFR